MWKAHYDASGFTPSEEIKRFIPDIEETPKDTCYISEENDKSKKFEIRKDFKRSILEYPNRGNDPGKVLIFNMYTFLKNEDPQKTPKNRHGSLLDVQTVITCLQRQGFNINEKDVRFDFTTKEFGDTIDEVCTSDLSQANCLIMFYFSHGCEDGKLQTYDGIVEVKDIFNKFAQCETLKGKPKVFIIQACKGKHSTTTTDSVEDNILDKYTFSENLPPDMLVLYSSIEGKVAFRSPFFGSWFIHELCKNISAYASRDDLVSIAIRTTKCVSGNYYNLTQRANSKKEIENVYEKQLPLTISSLKRKFYLNTNKDRHLLIKLTEDLKSLREEVFRMEEKLNNINRKK